MSFLDRIAREQAEEFSTIRYEFQADLASGRLSFRETVLEQERELHSWTFSVLARDIDPRLVEITEPDSGNVRRLRAVCSLYRDVVRGTLLTPSQPPQHQRFVDLSLPLSGEVSDADEVIEDFQQFLAACGAKSPKIVPAEIQDLISPLRTALVPASGVMIPSKDGEVTYEQSATLVEEKLLLVHEVGRPRNILDSRYTFELLSLDTKGIDYRQVPEDSQLWILTLPSIERLETTLRQFPPWGEDRWPYTKLMFSSQPEAGEFARVCAHSVPQLRERLYNTNYEI